MTKNFKAKIVLLLVCILFIASACSNGRRTGEFTYDGAYPELYTLAVNSLLGARGFRIEGIRANPPMTILETDSYGRILFRYNEDIFGT